MTLFFRSMRFPIIICAFSPFFCVFSRSDVVVHKSVTVFFTCTSACQGLAQYPDATEELKGSTTGTCCCARSFSANSASMRFTSSCIFMLLIFSCAKSFDSLLFSATNLSHFTRSSSTCNYSQQQMVTAVQHKGGLTCRWYSSCCFICPSLYASSS